MPRTVLLAIFYAGMAVMLAFWVVSSGAVALGIFAIVFGACYGGFVAILPALAMDFFGARSLAGIIGFLYTAAALGNLLGPWLAGVAYDAGGSYTVPIVTGAACMLLAFGLALASRGAPRYVEP
jgi:predicted MFS family arabinose efflux permease